MVGRTSYAGDYSMGAHETRCATCSMRSVIGARPWSGTRSRAESRCSWRINIRSGVDRLVLVAPGGFGREVSLLLRAASVPGSGSVLAIAAWRPFVQAGALLTQLLARLGVHRNTDLEEIGQVYALLAHREARPAFVHTLRAVVDHQGQRVSALEQMDVTKSFPSLIIWGERDRVVPVSTASSRCSSARATSGTATTQRVSCAPWMSSWPATGAAQGCGGAGRRPRLRRCAGDTGQLEADQRRPPGGELELYAAADIGTTSIWTLVPTVSASLADIAIKA
jgi:hypothetical protein